MMRKIITEYFIMDRIRRSSDASYTSLASAHSGLWTLLIKSENVDAISISGPQSIKDFSFKTLRRNNNII